MKMLSPTNADSSVSFTIEFTKEQRDFIPHDVSYLVCRTLTSDLSCVKITEDLPIEDPANLIEITLTPEQLHWDPKYTEDILIVLKYYDEEDYFYTEGISFKITRVSCP